MRRCLGIAFVVLLTFAGLVYLRLTTLEEHLDLRLSFGVPGSVESRGTMKVDGKVVPPVTTGWVLSYNGEAVLEPPTVVTWDDLVDAGELAEDWVPPEEEYVSGILREAFQLEGRFVPTAGGDGWTQIPNLQPCLWFRPVKWLHPGDLLDAFLVVLARNPGSGQVRIGLLRLRRETPAVITGWSGTGDGNITVTDLWTSLRTGVRRHFLNWKFGLGASEPTMESVGLLGPNHALREAGASGWYQPPVEVEQK